MEKTSQAYKRTTVTAALPYANGPLHIGHLAGAYLSPDIYVRYLRLRGHDVLFLCGSDEHGVAITIRARQEGIPPRELIDKYHALNKAAFDKFRLSFDVYSRTSYAIHHETAQAFFRRFYERGELVEQSSQQYFDTQEQMFLPDRYLVGTCPRCGYENAYGDQCESCGSSLAPTDLLNPRSQLSGQQPELRETRHWFFPLDQYQDWLAQYIVDEHPEWKTNVRGQCRSWLNEGLQPRAITRDLDWGVDVPVEGAEGKKLYVWFDAPIGYISAARDWAQQRAAQDPQRYSEADWKPYWQDSDTRLLHFIGKDNIVFHCLIFPAILKGHGDYIWADNVPANEFMNLEQQKISTSRNWAIWLHEFVDEHPDLIDEMRYVLTANMPETSDSDFSWDDFQARNNNELVAILGNFVHRVLSLIHKNFEKQVPQPGELTEADRQALANVRGQIEQLSQDIERFRFRPAAAALMEVARLGNRYLAETEPWHLLKGEAGARQRAATVLYTGAQIVAQLSTLVEPFMPGKAERLRELLQLQPLDWTALDREELLPPGHPIAKPKLLFQKLEDSFVAAERQKLENARATRDQQAQAIEEAKPEIDIETFQQLDLRIATVQQAEKVPKADKLLKLTVHTGLDERTVVAGVAKQYAPEALIGRQVVLLANLAPRKLRGIPSQGMVLMGEAPDGTLRLLEPSEALPNGSIIR